MKIAIGNDHVAVEMKQEIVALLKARSIEVINVGTDESVSCHYPAFGLQVANLVARGEADLGILICGTGIGMSLVANKVQGIRCCACSEPYSAKLSRMHNNANVLSLGARVIGAELAKMIVEAWLDAEFEGGRHQTRVDMITQIEQTGAL